MLRIGLRMRRKYALVVTVALGVPLASCSSPQDSPASASRKPDEARESFRLTGTGWVRETLDGRDPSGEPFTLGFFEDGHLEGQAVCNHFGARHAPGTDFHLSEELGRTNFECGASEAARREEDEFLEIMAQADGLDATREELEIEDSASGRTLVFAPKPSPPSDPALDGTEWILVSLRGRAPVDGPPVTIEFDGEGASGYAGCNRYGVRFEGAPEAPRIATLDMTATGCPSEELARQEEDYAQALGEYAGHEVLGDRLKVLGERGETLLTYKRKGKRNNDPAALGPPNRSADMEGILVSIEPSVPLVEGCALISAASSVTTMTHSPGDEQPCDAPGAGAVGHVLVEHDEGEWVDKMRLAVTEETLVLRHSREGFVRVTFEELEGGQFVRAWASGPVGESYPAQADAGTIVVDDKESGRGSS